MSSTSAEGLASCTGGISALRNLTRGSQVGMALLVKSFRWSPPEAASIAVTVFTG